MRLSEEELIRELREERPEVDDEFGQKLDEWAADGFPRGGPQGDTGRPRLRSRIATGIEGARERFGSIKPRRLIAPVGAAATLVVVAGIAISQTGGPPDQTTVTPTADPDVAEEPLEDLSLGEAPPGESSESLPPAEGSADDPVLRSRDSAAGLSGGTGDDVSDERGRGDAEIARDARLVLGAEADEVQEVADGVNEVVNRHRGYVVNSDVESGDGSVSPGADFRLRIPAANLQPALADLSELAHVESRNEGTLDITGRVVSAESAIESLEERIDVAEDELVTAEGSERKELEALIEQLESELAIEEKSLAQAQQRVDLVPVDVEIVTDSGDGSWGFDEALEDAGDVLTTIGGGLLVAGAVVLPFALLGGIAYAINRRRVRAARDRALD